MTTFSVEPDQLSIAAETVERRAMNLRQTPALGYAVTSAELGAPPLGTAVDLLQESCATAMRTLVDDLAATAVNLRRTIVRYITTDTDLAADLVSVPQAERP